VESDENEKVGKSGYPLLFGVAFMVCWFSMLMCDDLLNESITPWLVTPNPLHNPPTLNYGGSLKGLYL